MPMQNGAQHLSSLEDHLNDVLVGMVPGAPCDVPVKYKNIHLLLSNSPVDKFGTRRDCHAKRRRD